jgi:hypothetical protein
MRNIQFAAILLVFAVFIFACNKNSEDDTKPVIELEEPADGDTLFVGYDLHLDMELSDNVKLKSYKIDIHSDLDNHGHTKSAKADVAWTFTKSWDVSGMKNAHVHHHEITVPATINGSPIARGKYHFMVYCTDEAGNESFIVKEVIVDVGIPEDED